MPAIPPAIVLPFYSGQTAGLRTRREPFCNLWFASSTRNSGEVRWEAEYFSKDGKWSLL